MTVTVAEIKESYRMELAELGARMTTKQKMEVAINLNITVMTVSRYQSGKEEEVRNIELAEKILLECRAVINKPENTPA